MKLEVLTSESFADYGYLLNGTKQEPDADTPSYTYYADIVKFHMDGGITAGVLEGKKREIELTCMERHKQTPEILIAIQADTVLFVGLSNNHTSEITGIKAFLFKERDVIMMKEGTWHWVPFPTNMEKSITQVIYKNDTGKNDYQLETIAEPIRLDE